MNQLRAEKPNITFLFSDTGGGHRAASEAIIEAIHCEFGNTINTRMVDFLKDYAPPPFNHLPEAYPDLVRLPELYGAMFEISDGRPQARFVTSTLWPIVRNAALNLVKDHHSEMLVSVHPLATSFVLKALGPERPPFVTVVTDLVSTHALWYDQRADLILVPTEQARSHALQFKMSPEKVRVVGQPIADRCTASLEDKRMLRQRFGWPQDKLVVLLVGGGEGMGPLAETARAIDESGLDVGQIIVTGRNAKLEADLREQGWENPTIVYGFTHDMPDFMRAADVLVTKAGPGTIAEALTAGLPIILYAKLPGQEDGNVDFVEAERVGVWAPEPVDVVRTLTRWVCRPQERAKVAEACRRAARPHAARQIAHILAAQVGLPEHLLEAASSDLQSPSARNPA
jgi:1,2-diacylglycerol 3-beta-galactosyltransferase